MTHTETLVKGQRYKATTTGTIRGERFYRPVTFIAARDQEPEPFIRGREMTPDQDRVFVASHFGSEPRLYVAGSIHSEAEEDGR